MAKQLPSHHNQIIGWMPIQVVSLGKMHHAMAGPTSTETYPSIVDPVAQATSPAKVFYGWRPGAQPIYSALCCQVSIHYGEYTSLVPSLVVEQVQNILPTGGDLAQVDRSDEEVAHLYRHGAASRKGFHIRLGVHGTHPARYLTTGRISPIQILVEPRSVWAGKQFEKWASIVADICCAKPQKLPVPQVLHDMFDMSFLYIASQVALQCIPKTLRDEFLVMVDHCFVSTQTLLDSAQVHSPLDAIITPHPDFPG